MGPVDRKHCPWCHRTLELERFAADPRSPDGRSSRCGDCAAGRRSPPAPEPCLSDLVAHPTPPENPWIEAKRERNRAPNRHAARKAVERAIRAGILEPKPCEYRFEGCVGRPTQAHHESYEPSRWLDVRWVCRPCHDLLTVPARAGER